MTASIEITPQEAAQELLERKYAREGLQVFVERVGEVAPAYHHLFLIDHLERVECGEIKRLMVFMPPGSAKSTYTSILFPPWYLGRNPKNNVITASHTAELAESFGRKVRNIVSSQEFHGVFKFGLLQDSKAAGRWGVEHGGEYYAVGVGGSVTGRRADLGLIDDPVKSREDADSETIRNKVWDWYLSDFRTRLKPGASIVLIQTRWHEDDLAGRILPEDYKGQSGQVMARDGEVWTVVSLPAVAEENDAMGRHPGEVLWPEWFSHEMFDQERITQGERNWSALYQQRPSPETGTYFKREWVRWYDNIPKFLQIYGASDYAVTEDGGDYTVHGVAGVDPDDNLYILDWWRGQTTTDVWIEQLLQAADAWHPSEWGEESGQIEKSVGPFIAKRQREEKNYFYRKQYPSAHDKPTRAQAFRGRMAQGKVFFPKNAPWINDLISELMAFPAGKNDDQVDVLSLFGRMLARMSKGQVPETPEKPRWETPASKTFNELVAVNRKKRLADQ
jgi:predicted phage terminase large subunit-like protein